MSTVYTIIAIVFSSALIFGMAAWAEHAENPKHNFWISKKIKKHELQLAQKELEKELAKNPPPVQPVRRSRRQKSGFSILIDGFFKVDKELTRLTNRWCYFNDPKYNRRRKKYW